MLSRLLISILIVCPALAAADKTPDKLLEVLRELGGLEEHLKVVEKSLSSKMADLGQSAADQARTAGETTKSLAAIDGRLRKGLQDQQDQQTRTLGAVAALGSQVQALASDMSTLRQAVNDLTASMAKLSTQLGDLSTAVNDLKTAKPDANPPAESATDLFAAAEGDRSGGKLDLALDEYTAYMAKFATTAQAPDAQYYIGSIHYSKQELEDAAKAFDTFIQTFPDNRTRMPAVLFYKADSLARLGRGPEATDTLKDLRTRFPNDPLAKRALTVKPPARLQ